MSNATRNGWSQTVIVGVLAAGAAGLTPPPQHATDATPTDWRALLAPLPGADAVAAALRARVGGDVATLATEHFVVAHTAAAPLARDLALRLEAVYRANVGLARELRLPARRPPAKLGVILLASHAEFRAQAADDHESLGCFAPAAGHSVFFDLRTHPAVLRWHDELLRDRPGGPPEHRRLADRLRRNTQALTIRVVQHEAAHQVQQSFGLFADAGQAPGWLVEGLAQLFELPFVEEGATLELATNRYRLFEFTQLYADDARWAAELRRIVADPDGWRGGPDYPLAWALTNYLYKRRRACLAAYLGDLAAPPPPATQPALTPAQRFERAFGPLDDEFFAGFTAYMRQLRERHAERAAAMAGGADRR